MVARIPIARRPAAPVPAALADPVDRAPKAGKVMG